MKISYDYPPNIEKIRETFDLTGKTPVFTYGDTIYNPHKGFIPADLLIHERTHQVQQGEAPDEWWDKYLTDSEFRLMEEIEAYCYQYKAFCEVYRDRNQRFDFLNRLAKDLSSAMYGNIISYSEAVRVLRHGTKNIIKK